MPRPIVNVPKAAPVEVGAAAYAAAFASEQLVEGVKTAGAIAAPADLDLAARITKADEVLSHYRAFLADEGWDLTPRASAPDPIYDLVLSDG